MGSFFTKMSNRNLGAIQGGFVEVLLRLTPEILLTLVLINREIYEFCKNDEVLRQACIVAAVKKYYSEKYQFEEVRDRTANYMVLLDEFLLLQDQAEMEKQTKTSGLRYFKWFSTRDPTRKLAKKVEETKGGGDGTKGDVEGRDAMDGAGRGDLEGKFFVVDINN